MGCCCCFEGWLSYRQTVPKCCFKNQDYWGKASHTNPWKTHPVSSHSLTHILVKFSYDCETYIYYTYLDVSSLASVFFQQNFKKVTLCVWGERGGHYEALARLVCVYMASQLRYTKDGSTYIIHWETLHLSFTVMRFFILVKMNSFPFYVVWPEIYTFRVYSRMCE